MSISFNHLNRSALIGNGIYKFRHIITPSVGLEYISNNYGTWPTIELKVYSIGSCQDIDVIIPETVRYPIYGQLPVVSIGNSCFQENQNLKSIKMSKNIYAIGSWAFAECHFLQKIDITENIISLGEYMLHDCTRLTSISIHKNIETIPEYMCYACRNLSDIKLAEGVKYINNFAFYYCNFKNIVIPESVERIGFQALYSSAENSVIRFKSSIPPIIDHNDDFKFFRNRDDIIIEVPNDSIELYKSILPDYENCFRGYQKCLDTHNIVIDNYIAPTCTETGLTEGKHCSKCGEIIQEQFIIDKKGHNFNENGICVNCSESQDTWASEGLSYRLLSNGTYAVSIGTCKDLDINIPSSHNNIKVTQIDTFSNSEIISITLPESITYITNNAFEYCDKLTTIRIPEGVEKIGKSAFYECKNLHLIYLPSTIKRIEQSAFFRECTWMDIIYVYNGTQKQFSEVNIGSNSFYTYVYVTGTTTRSETVAELECSDGIQVINNLD